MKVPNIIIYPDAPHSACSWWRGIGPYIELARENKINMAVGTWDDTWSSLRAYDIAVFQRPMTKFATKQVEYCKKTELKIIVDLDDYNMPPKDHVMYEVWQEQYTEQNFIKILSMADVVTVSTEYLREHYSMYHRNVILIPNAVNDYWMSGRTFKKGKTIFLRGGSHKDPDIYEYKDEIIEVLRNNPEWKLEVAGTNPIWLQKEIPEKQYSFLGDLDIWEYFGYILSNEVNIFIAPLKDNDFNRSKSNIVWQEATLAGATALIPDYMEVEDELCFKYSDKGYFKDYLEALMASEDTRLDFYTKSFKTLKKDFLLSKWNEKRLEILNGLI